MLWDVAQTAEFLHVSASWVRRHLVELPVIRCGRLLRFDSAAIGLKLDAGKSLKPKEPIMVNRFQRGSVYLRGKKKMWYGKFRLETLNAKGERNVANVPLGTVRDLPNKTDARKKLTEVMEEMLKPCAVPPSAKKMKFSELADEWKTVEGPAILKKSKASYKHWVDTLRAYILDWVPLTGGMAFKDRLIADIQRRDVQQLLNEQAAKYSESTLRSMKIVLRKVLLYAEVNAYIQRPTGWLNKIALPEAHGRTLERAHLTPEQTLAFVDYLPEPYSTLVLFLAYGSRGEEAVGLKPTDLDGNNILTIRRIIYNREVTALTGDDLKVLPLTDPALAGLVERLRKLGKGHEWIFRTRAGTPLDLGNARRRYLHPAAAALGTPVGGWHDFRHALVHTLRKDGVHSKVISKVVGHKTEGIASRVYDHAEQGEIRDALGVMGRRLVPRMVPNAPVN